MLIDCDRCTARPAACSDCVVGVLLGTPEVPGRAGGADGAVDAVDAARPATPREPGGPLPVEFGPVEQRALEVLADHGLIPRLRLVTTPEPQPDVAAGSPGRGVAGPIVRGRRDVG